MLFRSSPAPVAPAPAAASPAKPADPAALWPGLLDAVGRSSPFARSYLLEAHPVSLVGDVFTIGFDPEFSEHLGLVNNSKTISLLQAALAAAGHRGMQVRFIEAPAPEGWAARKPAAEPAAPAAAPAAASAPAAAREDKPKAPVPIRMEDFKNDPLIQKALEVFKGTIVEVRA